MKKPITFFILSALFVLIAGCNDNEVKQFSKEGAVETILNVDHLDDTHDIIVTTHKIWVKNELIKTTVHKDTIPTLGLTYEPVEKSDGNMKTVPIKRDYELYITVK
jgi:hypothetical protein